MAPLARSMNIVPEQWNIGNLRTAKTTWQNLRSACRASELHFGLSPLHNLLWPASVALCQSLGWQWLDMGVWLRYIEKCNVKAAHLLSSSSHRLYPVDLLKVWPDWRQQCIKDWSSKPLIEWAPYFLTLWTQHLSAHSSSPGICKDTSSLVTRFRDCYTYADVY